MYKPYAENIEKRLILRGELYWNLIEGKLKAVTRLEPCLLGKDVSI